MEMKKTDGQLWCWTRITNFGTYESFEALKKAIAEVDKEITKGDLKDVSLQMQYTDNSGYEIMALVGYRPATEQERKWYESEGATNDAGP